MARSNELHLAVIVDESDFISLTISIEATAEVDSIDVNEHIGNPLKPLEFARPPNLFVLCSLNPFADTEWQCPERSLSPPVGPYKNSNFRRAWTPRKA